MSREDSTTDSTSTPKRKARHGHARRGSNPTPEYKAWCHLKERCLNPTHPNYHNYGGRGITVCDRWRDSFEAFLEDMGRRPSKGHTIERVDNDKGYCPENCVWATRMEQADNRRSTVHHELNGERRNQSEWARASGIPQCTISLRLKRGWSPEDALTRKPNYEKTPPVEYDGQTHSLMEWSRITGLDYGVLHTRFRRGWDVGRMLTTPAQRRTRKA